MKIKVLNFGSFEDGSLVKVTTRPEVITESTAPQLYHIGDIEGVSDGYLHISYLGQKNVIIGGVLKKRSEESLKPKIQSIPLSIIINVESL